MAVPFTKTFDKQSALEKGAEMVALDERIHIVQLMKKYQVFETHGIPAYIAITNILSQHNGIWDKRSVCTALLSHAVDADFEELERVLLDAEILEISQTNKFSYQFLYDLELIRDKNIELAPANMRPLHSVEDWEIGKESPYHLHLISNMSDKRINKLPQNILDAVNRLQAVEYLVNPDLLVSLQYLEKDLERKANKNKFPERTVILQKAILEQQKHDLETLIALDRAVQFAVTLCFRGRGYYRGGMITPQGPDFCKAAFMFKNKKKLGKYGKEALAIHYANVAGQDKISIEKRIEWANTVGMDRARDIAINKKFPNWADEPYQTTVVAYDWYRLMLHEYAGMEAKDYKSQIVVHQDGSCNGYQHGAALLKDRATAEATNCTSGNKKNAPRDIYKDVAVTAEKLQRKLGMDALADIQAKYGRAGTKYSVMVTGFGAGIATAMKQYFDVIDPSEKMKVQAYTKSSKVLATALKEHGGAVIHFTDLMKEAVEKKMEQGIVPLEWKTKDGFPVFQASRAKGDGRQYGGFGDFEYRIDLISAVSQVSGIAANFIHSLDSTHMRMTVMESNFPIVNIHDSYGCHAGNYKKLQKTIRKTFVELYTYDQMKSFNKMNNLNVVLPQGDYEPKEVMKSPYFFT